MESALGPLLALAGSCFAGDVAPGARDVHCFTSVYGGSHVRDEHKVSEDGKTVYQGETIYSVQGGVVTFTYFSSIGGIGHGAALLAPGDWGFALDMRATPDSALTHFETRWIWRGSTSYTVSGGPAPVTFRRIAR